MEQSKKEQQTTHREYDNYMKSVDSNDVENQFLPPPIEYALCVSTASFKGVGKKPVCPGTYKTYKAAKAAQYKMVDECKRNGGKQVRIGNFPSEEFEDNVVVLLFRSSKTKKIEEHYEIVSIVPVFSWKNA